jgi:hypothetical protein
MAMEERKGAALNFVVLKDIDFQKAFELAEKIASKTGGIFNGISSFSFVGPPPRDKESINLFLDPSKINEAIAELSKGLGLTLNDGYIIQAIPTVQYVPRGQMPRTTA